MTKRENRAIGVDIGTSRIVAAVQMNDVEQVSAQLNAFLPMPYSKITEAVFRREGVPYVVEGGEMIVYGNEAAKLANLLNRETRRPMTRGVLNPNEPNGLEMVKRLVAGLVGKAKYEGEPLCFSVPGAPQDAPDDLTYHEATLRGAFGELGYKATSINEGLAVVLAELEDSNYTGIGISFGGGMCNVCMAYLSVPVFSFSIGKAGDFIDSSAASVAGEGATRIRAIKEESFHFNGMFADKVKQALSVYYDDVIRAVVHGLKEEFGRSRNMPRFDRPLPLVVSGGSSLPNGFRARFEKHLTEAQLPVDLAEIRAAKEPLNATARGALVAALAEI